MEIAEEELGNTRTSGKAMYRKAMDLFQEVYEDWRSRLGELSIKTVKAITMLATVANRMDGPLAAIEWSKKEVPPPPLPPVQSGHVSSIPPY